MMTRYFLRISGLMTRTHATPVSAACLDWIVGEIALSLIDRRRSRI